jgi:photosystem II stability/assembly factor-like uncharacterized protein
MKKFLFALLTIASSAALYAQSWTPMAAGLLPDSVVIFSISAVSDQVVWAVASEEIYQGPIPASVRPIILRTSDGGQNWVVKPVEEAFSTISFQIVAEDSLTAWITTQDYNTGPGRSLYKTTDGGEVWVKKHTNVATGVALNQFPDGQHWLAHNRQSISRSANDGDNWTNGTAPGYQSDEFQILNSGANMSSTVGDTLWNGTSAGRIIRFTNYGASSEFFNTGFGTTSTILSVAFQDHLNGLLYYTGDFGLSKVAKTTDGGATWTNLSQQPGVGRWNIIAVPGAPGSYALATNYNFAAGKIALTKDFGATWTVENLNKSLNAISFASPSSGWAGGGRLMSSAAPALFKYVGAPLVGTEVAAETLVGVTVSPNPVLDVLRFDIEGIGANEPVLVTLCDLSGRQLIQQTVFEKQLNVGYLPSGIYLLKLETSEGWAMRKIVRE